MQATSKYCFCNHVFHSHGSISQTDIPHNAFWKFSRCVEHKRILDYRRLGRSRLHLPTSLYSKNTHHFHKSMSLRNPQEGINNTLTFPNAFTHRALSVHMYIVLITYFPEGMFSSATFHRTELENAVPATNRHVDSVSVTSSVRWTHIKFLLLGLVWSRCPFGWSNQV